MLDNTSTGKGRGKAGEGDRTGAQSRGGQETDGQAYKGRIGD